MENMADACVPFLQSSCTSSKLTDLVDRFDSIVHARAREHITDSAKLEAAQFVEDLDLDESEDEGEIMLMAMILLQLHGVKFRGETSSMSSSFDEAQDELNKKKRQRTSPEQLAILEQIFQTDKMPSQQTRVQLADQLGMSSRRVQIWFQNKRAKVKRGLNKSSDDISPDMDGDSIDSPSEQELPSSPPGPQYEMQQRKRPALNPSPVPMSSSRLNPVPTTSPRNIAPFPFVSSFESPPILVNFFH